MRTKLVVGGLVAVGVAGAILMWVAGGDVDRAANTLVAAGRFLAGAW